MPGDSVARSVYSGVVTQNDILTQRNKALQLQNNLLLKQLEVLQTQTQIQIDVKEQTSLFSPQSMFDKIVERDKHFKLTKKKKQYDPEEYKFWITIRTKAPSIYQLMIDQFDAPCDSSVRQHKYALFKKLGISENLVGEEFNCEDKYIKMYAERVRDPHGSKWVPGGLSCDDAKVNAQQKVGPDGEIIGSIKDLDGNLVPVTDLFVYIFSPYDKTKEKLVVFAQVCFDGKARLNQLETMRTIRQTLEKHFLLVKNYCSDGDRYWNEVKSQAFKRLMASNNNFNPYTLLDVNKDDPLYDDLLWCGDFYHLLKNLRYRIVSDDHMSMSFTPDQNSFNASKLRALLGEGSQYLWRDDLNHLKMSMSLCSGYQHIHCVFLRSKSTFSLFKNFLSLICTQ
ncbi:Hypothetical_protein [Hexamita inflata]|uniref:Hypothetical_protein n=1 Tax=Hexamita inflata TaxID=28002 RepID=A0AA86UFG7_9EUKA|nr:Hypothetical protein HINF_LOCUS43725 [Hexamita inflata]